ncbi:ABC-F family ATP-binding cassette domain-containing protein [Meiothermus ruber]|uniref:ABC-F family ATP-binding cassette domain-containing protein n=1 Tax=Meiothermus ruber TaxID=277 RepID=UPI000347BE4A|nr:ABC-F family ATP-binding cassette domain-containing protein [Meiothermus ruber]MCL6528811.1 ATP-binding cassette domain-containing protein [Meiothermus ruber]GAO75048.1 ABC transporter [Meiothermus ruber H328]
MRQPRVLLRLHQAEKAFGERVLFRQADFWIEAGERAALMGPNGAGKSTLFRVLCGEKPLDQGRLVRPAGVRVFYLPQDFRPAGGTVYELAYAVTPLHRAELELRNTPPENAGEVWSRIRELSFWKGQVARTLAGFGLGALWEQPVEKLSGGEGVRLGLAMAFLSGAEVLLLDEPTTHLDLRMRLRLEELLLAYPGAVGLISHDRVLVRRVATTVYHLEAGRLFRVPGGYATYLQERERIRRTLEKARLEALKERERLTQALPDRRRPGLDRRKSEKARLQTRAERIQVPDPPPPERRWSLEIAAEGTPRLVLEAKNLEKAYGTEQAVRKVIRQATLRIFRGDRIALLGPNGVGKTTLLRLLLSRELPDAGERTQGYGVSTAYLDQHYHGLEPDLPLFAQFAARFGEARAAALLGRMGFRPPHWNDPPRGFSGGERARAGLALLGALRAGLLVMDEPTNHIELELLEALERALADYPGTLLFVSHDRELVKKVATRFWGLEDGVLVEYPTYAEAEAALLGKPALRLDPYGEVALEEEPSEEAQDLEALRMALLERLYEPHQTDRARLRLRADLLALEEALYRQYAHEFFRPHPYRYRVRQAGLEVFAEEELGLWQFWSREEVCWGQLANGVLLLEDSPSPRLLQVVLRIAFELEGAQVVRVGRQSYGRSSYLKQFTGAAPVSTRRPSPRKRHKANQRAPKP